MADAPDNYDDLTVSELESEAADVEDPDVIQAWIDHEKDQKGRVTAIKGLEERLDELTETEPEVEPEPEGEDETDDEPAAGAEMSERIRVRNPEKSGKHVARHSFAAGESKIIPARPDVRDAIRRGELQYVGPR